MEYKKLKKPKNFKFDKDQAWMVRRRVAMNLMALRRQRELTQIDLAEQSGMPRSTIAYIESAKGNTSIEKLSYLAQFFNVAVTAFFISPCGEPQLYKKKDVFKELPPGVHHRRVKILPNKTQSFVLGRHEQLGLHVTGGKVLARGEDLYHFVGRGQTLTVPGELSFGVFNYGKVPAEILLLKTAKPLN